MGPKIEKITVKGKIPDLLMLQQRGKLEDLFTLLNTNKDPNSLIESVRSDVSVEGLHSHIIDETVHTQFPEFGGVLKDLVQNAVDAQTIVGSGVIKVINNPGKHIAIVKDTGVGMDPSEVIQNLLIPWETTKDENTELIGTHGIGWFSCLSLSEKVEVVTYKDGRETEVKVWEEDGDWHFDLTTSESKIRERGTKIKLDLKQNNSITPHSIENELIKYCGFVDGGNKIIYYEQCEKGQTEVLINSISTDFNSISKVEIENQGITGEIILRINNEGAESSPIKLTQNGLFVRKLGTYFEDKSFERKISDGLRSNGIEMVIDIPNNLTLTTGRNNVISQDKEVLDAGINDVFKKYIFEVVLDDDSTLDKISNVLEDIIINSLETKIETSFNLELKRTVLKARRKLSEARDNIDKGTYEFKIATYRFARNSINQFSLEPDWFKELGKGVAIVITAPVWISVGIGILTYKATVIFGSVGITAGKGIWEGGKYLYKHRNDTLFTFEDIKHTFKRKKLIETKDFEEEGRTFSFSIELGIPNWMNRIAVKVKELNIDREERQRKRMKKRRAKKMKKRVESLNKEFAEKQFIPVYEKINGKLLPIKVSIEELIQAKLEGKIVEQRWINGTYNREPKIGDIIIFSDAPAYLKKLIKKLEEFDTIKTSREKRLERKEERLIKKDRRRIEREIDRKDRKREKEIRKQERKEKMEELRQMLKTIPKSIKNSIVGLPSAIINLIKKQIKLINYKRKTRKYLNMDEEEIKRIKLFDKKKEPVFISFLKNCLEGLRYIVDVFRPTNLTDKQKARYLKSYGVNFTLEELKENLKDEKGELEYIKTAEIIRKLANEVGRLLGYDKIDLNFTTSKYKIKGMTFRYRYLKNKEGILELNFMNFIKDYFDERLAIAYGKEEFYQKILNKLIYLIVETNTNKMYFNKKSGRKKKSMSKQEIALIKTEILMELAQKIEEEKIDIAHFKAIVKEEQGILNDSINGVKPLNPFYIVQKIKYVQAQEGFGELENLEEVEKDDSKMF